MTRARLDQILLGMGMVTEAQIQKALLRQKACGGRLGTHLLYFRFIGEEQLVKALAEQARTSGVLLGAYEIPDDVIRMLPAGVAEEFVAIPFRCDAQKTELHLAAADPGNAGLAPAARRASGVPRIVVHIAPEAVIRSKIAFHYHGRVTAEPEHVIDLPDLFAGEPKPVGSPAPEPPAREGAAPRRSYLMYTGQLFLRNVLPAIFEREGLSLEVATDAAGLAAALRIARADGVLVSEEVKAGFDRLVAERGDAPMPPVIVFRSVGGALLENLVPYDRMFECLLVAVQYIADQRTSALPSAPPYSVISKEIGELGAPLGLGRLAVDGLQISAHLLVPPSDLSAGLSDPTSMAPPALFADREGTLRIAKYLSFPWDVAAGLEALFELLPAPGAFARLYAERRDLATAVGTLALVWYRHNALQAIRADAPGDLEFLKTRLRSQADRLAPSPVVEAYIRMLESADATIDAGKDIVIVGEVALLAPRLISDLKHHGFRVVEAGDLEEAYRAYRRRRPSAVVVFVDESLPAADRFCRRVREEHGDPATLLFAVTKRSDPSYLLNLMETWFNDVLPLPMNSHVVVARISKALSARGKEAGGAAGQGFSATFRDLPFADLVQSLGTAGKSVRMRIEHGSGMQAEIHFRKGRIVCAACGDLSGADVVYEVILWQDDGAFRVEPVREFPAPNVTASTEYLLLEGVRKLDESRR